MSNRGSHRRTVGWNIFFQYAGIGLLMVNGIVLVPMYLVYIPKDIYGYWLATGNVLAWLSLVDPGFSSIIQQRVATSYGAGDHARVGAYLVTGAMLAFVLGGLVGLAGLTAGNFLHAILGVGTVPGWSDLVGAFTWAVAGAALSFASFSLTAGALGLQGSLGPGIIYAVTQVTALGVTVYGLLHGWGVLALGVANFVRGLGLFMGGAGYLLWRIARERIACSFSRSILREVLGLSGFTLFAKIPGTLSGQMDAFIAARFIGPEAAVMLGLTRRGYDMARMVADRPTVALMPVFAHLAGEGDHKRLRATFLRLARWTMWAAGLLVAGFWALNHDFVRLWVGSEYYAGPLINALLALNMGLTALIGICAGLGFALGDVQGNSMATFLSSLVSIGLIWLGAHLFGLRGIVAAPLVSLLLVGAVYFPRALAARLHATKEDWTALAREGLLVVGLGIVCVVGAGLAKPQGWISFAGVVAGCAALYGLGIGGGSPAGRSEATAVLKRLKLRA